MSTSSNIQPSIENQSHTNNTQPPSFQPINPIKLVLTKKSKITAVVKEYDTTAEELNNCILELEGELKEINKEIQKKHTSLHGPKLNTKLGKCVVISVFTDIECKVEIVLIYAVYSASWTAGYDICVNTHTYKEPVTLIYKASITQSTGEDWADSLLTLETTTPTFGLNIPKLDVWNLSVYKPTPPTPSIEYKFKSPWTFARSASLPAHTIIPIAHSMHESKVMENSFELKAPMYHQGLDVVSSSGKGNVSATF
ncbi:Protein F37C4.5 [Termitomyces sp. T112]|nr:Protein F37C4.5 [Termitomyces sp. T112]